MNRISIKQRIIIDIGLVFILIFFPWWVGSIIAIVLLFVVKDFFEILLFGLIVDSWYSVPSRELFGVGQGVFLSAVLLLLISVFKRKLIFYTQ